MCQEESNDDQRSSPSEGEREKKKKKKKKKSIIERKDMKRRVKKILMKEMRNLKYQVQRRERIKPVTMTMKKIVVMKVLMLEGNRIQCKQMEHKSNEKYNGNGSGGCCQSRQWKWK